MALSKDGRIKGLIFAIFYRHVGGAQWLSDRVLDLVVSSETHSRHCDVFLLRQIKKKKVYFG